MATAVIAPMRSLIRSLPSTASGLTRSIAGPSCTCVQALKPQYRRSLTTARSLKASATSVSSQGGAAVRPMDSDVGSSSVASTSTSNVATTAATLSPFKQKLLRSLAKVLGYNPTQTAAIRTSSDYYDRCAERDEKEGTFFYDECGLPKSYQSWMSITNLHIWLLSVRFRSLPPAYGKIWVQEMVNHYFIHAETLMRGRYNVKQGRLIKGHMRDMLYQYHGANMGYDEGLISGNDAILTAAIWRNLFGAGWGEMGGVKGKLAPKAAGQTSEGVAEQSQLSTFGLNLDPDLPPTPNPLLDGPGRSGGHHAGGSGLIEPLPPHVPAESPLSHIQNKDARFAILLERLVLFIRSEVNRMQKLSDQQVLAGPGLDRQTGESAKGSLTDFTRI